ncbi:family 2A encapsulin nanocompartment cargo protein cysteine desulfurase [Antrihabitans stalactiti]|uniref:cysteine desulfurase n=1 Tax=Antrihabitans stalactiti TaxID=2584121 RepID=A0A848KHC4_9NOCA|nr:family 2A encapsulin nanocompartment cargo protein cysteine desulfurase [Antrihabitans stalactiti]NMN97148.1 SufS family cysteine desulfurase [Antrihabitans stalactiti]
MTTIPSTGSDGGGLPSWLPDEATLNKLAGQFFSALPGSPGVTGAATPGVAQPGVAEPTLPTSQPSVPNAPPPPGGGYAPLDSPPLAVPVSPPNGPPSATAGTSHATTGAGLGVPFVPELPSLAAILPPERDIAPASPYYFISGTPGPDNVPNPPVQNSPPSGPLSSVQYGLPFTPEIPALAGVLPAQPDARPSSDFYFLSDLPDVDAPDLGTSSDPPLDVDFLDPHPGIDVNAVRRNFPILSERVNGYPLVWFDNAATTQKPQVVIDRVSYFYEHENSNIHRAAHTLAARSTDAYERARDIVARFIGASSAEDIIFVRGATEAINLVAQTWGRKNIREGDEIVLSHLEHHANIVPWQMLASETGAVIKVIPVDDSGQLLMGEYTKLLSDRTKLVSVTHVSNALGTVTPVHAIVEEGHRAGARILIDGAQSVPHTKVDMQSLGADFFVFSGHKIFGPTGIGVVYGTEEVLADMPPWQGGGNMITDVTFERSLYQPPPGRFEAGTGNIADAVGLGAALEYVERIGIDNISRYEHFLVEYATAAMKKVPGLHLVGTAAQKASVVSFVLDGYEPLEVGKALNEKGIAVRAGHHCAQPILRRFGLEATVRPSFAFYNTCEEIDRMVAALHQLSADAGRR